MAPPARSRWPLEALDVLERRAALRWIVTGVVVAIGALTSLVAPEVVAPRPLVGVGIAVAGLLLGVAVVTAVDAGDAVVRGPRHVRATGGELVGVLPEEPRPEAADDLAAAVLEARPGRRLTLGVAGAQAGAPTAAWSQEIAVALARRGASVLAVDLAGGATPQDGILEVLRDDRPLARAVTLDPELKLAVIGAGRDLDAALQHAVRLPERLPRDLEVLLVALPPIAKGDVLASATALDAVLVLAVSDRTRRARLQAAVEAVEAGGTTAQVVLVDGRLASVRRDRPAGPAAPAGSRVPASARPAPAGPSAEPASAPNASDDRESTAATGSERAPAVPTVDAEAPSPVDGVPADDRPDRGALGATDAPAPLPDAPAPLPESRVDAPPPTSGTAAPPATQPTDPATGPAADAPVQGFVPERSPLDVPPPGPSSPVDLGASPRPSVRLVRDVEPSPRRPLRPLPGPRSVGPSTDPADEDAGEVGPDPRTSEPAESEATPAVAEPRGVDELRSASRASALDALSVEPPTPERAPDDTVSETSSDGEAAPGAEPAEPEPRPVLRLAQDPPPEEPAAEGPAAEDPVTVDQAPEAPVTVDPVTEERDTQERDTTDPVAGATATDAPFEGSDTERIERDGAADLPRAVRGDEPEDPLRTTAQLALLMDHLEDREDPSN